MIIPEKKLIFVHIIKTAGVSIENFFNQPAHDHRGVNDYIDDLGEESFNDYFSFTIVRNPWDKMVSQYFFNAYKWVPAGTTFKEYIRLLGKGKKLTTFSPLQLPYIMNNSGDIIVDYVGRFERLQESFAHVCNTIGISAKKLPHYNKASHRNYREYYDEECKAIIAEVFRDDIQAFEYTFNGK